MEEGWSEDDGCEESGNRSSESVVSALSGSICLTLLNEDVFRWPLWEKTTSCPLISRISAGSIQPLSSFQKYIGRCGRRSGIPDAYVDLCSMRLTLLLAVLADCWYTDMAGGSGGSRSSEVGGSTT